MHTIFLIRHGESQSNAGLATNCPEEHKLTYRGVEQAKHIAAYLKSHSSPNLIVTSSYERTKQTATYTHVLFPTVPVTEWPVHEFTYLSSLHEEASTITERRPLVDAYWEQQIPFFVDDIGSESFENFIQRACDQLATWKTISYHTIAIFSHEQFIDAVLWLLEREPVEISAQTMQEFRQYFLAHRVPNGAIVRLQFRHRQHTWKFERITQHLEQLLGKQQNWLWALEQKVAIPVGSI